MKLKNFAIKVVAALTMAISLASCAGSGPGEHDHVWDGGTVTTEATCHSKGVRTFKCTVEGCEQTKTENIAMTAHNWGDGKVTKEPTCSVPGIRTFTCQNEGCNQSKTEAIPTIDHHYAPGDITKVPDLLEKGERQLVCNVCGDIKKEALPERADYSEQFGLEDSDWMFGYLDSFVAPTEESEDEFDIQPHKLELSEGSYKHGDVEFKKNSVSVGATECAFLGYLVPKDTHKLELNFTISFKGKEDNTRVNAYMVLYAETGAIYANEISEDAKDWTFAPEEALDVEEENLGGAYLSVIFKNAGEGEASGELSGCFTAECVHTWDNGQVTKAPTETAEGVRTHTCIKCGETYDEAIEKLPEHDAIKFVQDVNYFPRFDNKDDEGETIDFAGNAWLTNDGYTVHSEVTEKHEEDAWRGGVFLDTGVKLVKGHSIELTFESSIKEELGEGESFGLILQPKQWSETSERIKYLTSPLGDQSITIDIKEDYKDGENDATLWLALEMGTIENEIVLANIKAVDTGETPVDPHPERFDFTDKIENRCDTADGTIDVACTSTVSDSDFGHKATLDVTSACDDVWRAGMFVNTGYALEAGKTYTVKFNLERAEDENYEVILQNAQWKTDEQTDDDIRVAFLGKVVGEISEEIIITEANKGSLWICIQSGTAVNTISISDLVVNSEDTPDDPLKDYFDFKNKTHDRFDGAQGRTWLTDSNHTLNLEITTVGAEDWRGGVFVETGLTTEAGKSYEVSFEVSRPDSEKRNDFSIRFINKQWDEKEYAKLETPDGAVSKIFTVTNENAGSLWIYVQSGNQLNKISVTKLTAKEVTAHTVTITDTAHTLTEIVQEGREYTLPTWEHTAPEHHSFDYYDLAGVAKNPGDKILVNADKAINVVWKEDTKYTVSFDANGGTGSIQSKSVYAGDFTLPDYTGLVAPDGKHFKGWNIDDDTTLRDKGYVHNVTKDTVVKAIWEQNPVTTYTVTYKAGEGTGDNYVVENQFGVYTLVGNTTTGFTAPDGQLFKGWSVNSVTKAAGDTIDLDTLHDVEVIAIWATPVVSFNGNGAEGSMDSVTKLTGSKYQLPDNGFTVPSGKYFAGWYVGDDTTLRAVGYEITVTDDIEIKAIWGDFLVFTDKVSPRIDSPVVGSAEATTDGYGVQINITTADTEIYKGGATIHLEGIEAVGSYTLMFTGAFTERTATYEVLVGDTQFNKEYGAGYGLGEGNQSITFYAYRTGDYWLTIQCGNATGTVTLTNFKVVNNNNAYMLLNDRVSPRFDANDGRTGLAGTATVVNGYDANINVQSLPTDPTKIARWAGGAIVKLADSIAPGTYTLSFSSSTTDTREFELLIGYRPCEKDYFSYNGIKNGDHEFTFYAYNRAKLYLCFACGDTTGELVVSNFKLTKNSNYLKVASVEARIDTGGDGIYSRAGLAGSANLDQDGYGVTSTISHLPDLESVRERWAGGAIIKLTNSNVTTGKYQLRFNSSSEQGDAHKYEMGVDYRAYEHDYANQNDLVNGDHFIEFDANHENEPVWLCLGCGDTLGTISFTNFTLVRVGNLS